MVCLPIFRSIEVSNYGLFPGVDGNRHTNWSFDPGLSLIVGVNGLGKTTFVTMLLRSLTGPFDITGSGVPEKLESILPPEPRGLNRHATNFFAQRVADGADNAKMSVITQFAKKTVSVSRRLSDLYLENLIIDERRIELPESKGAREALFQEYMCDLFDLSSFVDVLLVLHHIVFFTERRSGALWDENAQRQILRALFLRKDLAAEVAQLEREVNKLDGRFRRTRDEANRTERELQKARREEAASPQVRAELEATQSVLRAEQERLGELEQALSELDEARRGQLLTYEKAKLDREESEAALERQKYARLLRMFPKMEDAARLLIIRILTKEECLVCGSDAREKREELEDLLSKGFCPACGADPERQRNIAPPEKLEESRLDKIAKRASLAAEEVEHAEKSMVTISSDYEQVLAEIVRVRQVVDNRKHAERTLVAKLPEDSETVITLERTVELLRRRQRKEQAESAEAQAAYRDALGRSRSTIAQYAKRLSDAFAEFIPMLLAEEAELVRSPGRARITQGSETFEVPAFVPQMTAADRSGKARRDDPTDVSESQRELIDLAFRLSLMQVAAKGSPCTLLMETPEASLDGVAMKRVGHALHMFAQDDGNRLVATSNLTNAGMIAAMFGGPTKSNRVIETRRRRVLNLMDVAAPNRAVEQDREAYDELLFASLRGAVS